MRMQIGDKKLLVQVVHEHCEDFVNGGIVYRPKYKNVTHAQIIDENQNREIGVGVSNCTHTDQFKRSLGTKIAVSRALGSSGLSKSERAELWNNLWGGKYQR